MPLLWKYFNKTYHLAHCDIRIWLRYNAEFLGSFEFDLDCISIGEIESGYEDDDQLTFYPNVLKLGFTDFEKSNYEYLKQVLESAPDYNFEDVSMIQLYYKGKTDYEETLMFSGYVDKNSLVYNDKQRTLEFECVDFAINLKNVTTRLFSNDWGWQWQHLFYLIGQIYESIYPNFLSQASITMDINQYKAPWFKGFYWKHNWKFASQWSEWDWGNVNMSNYSKIIFMFDPYFFSSGGFPFDTMTDLLKAIAIEFGLVIGTEYPYKVYMVKRFVKPSNVLPIAIDINNLIIGDLRKTLWLKNVICVVNNNVATGWRVTQGQDRQNPNRLNVPQNKETHLEIQTRFGCYSGTNSFTTVQVRANPQDDRWEGVFAGVQDPDLGGWFYFQDCITALYMKAREKAHSKYEFELTGINYSMADYYKRLEGYSNMKILRPLTLKKDLIENKTQVNALEIGLNL